MPMPIVTAPSLQQISRLAAEFRTDFAPLAMVALSNLRGQPASPHDSDLLPVIGRIPAIAHRLIEIAAEGDVDTCTLPLPVRVELIGRIARLIMERHGQADVMLAVSTGLLSKSPIPSEGALN